MVGTLLGYRQTDTDQVTFKYGRVLSCLFCKVLYLFSVAIVTLVVANFSGTFHKFSYSEYPVAPIYNKNRMTTSIDFNI